MGWSDLRKWVFLRGLLSGAIFGGLLGSFILPLIGTVAGIAMGFLIGGAVGVGTSITLSAIIRGWILSHPSHNIKKWVVCTLFVALNILFTIILFGGTVAISSLGSANERVIRMFNIGIVPALLSAIPAIYYTPTLIDKITMLEESTLE
jgi:hypothetical protein